MLQSDVRDPGDQETPHTAERFVLTPAPAGAPGTPAAQHHAPGGANTNTGRTRRFALPGLKSGRDQNQSTEGGRHRFLRKRVERQPSLSACAPPAANTPVTPTPPRRPPPAPDAAASSHRGVRADHRNDDHDDDAVDRPAPAPSQSPEGTDPAATDALATLKENANVPPTPCSSGSAPA